MRDINMDLQAARWYNELILEHKLHRWDEFESWLRADPLHRQAFKELEQGLPQMMDKILQDP